MTRNYYINNKRVEQNTFVHSVINCATVTQPFAQLRPSGGNKEQNSSCWLLKLHNYTVVWRSKHIKVLYGVTDTHFITSVLTEAQ